MKNKRKRKQYTVVAAGLCTQYHTGTWAECRAFIAWFLPRAERTEVRLVPIDGNFEILTPDGEMVL